MHFPVWAAETDDSFNENEDLYRLFDWWEGSSSKHGSRRPYASAKTRYAVRLHKESRNWDDTQTVLAGRSLLYADVAGNYSNIRFLGLPFIVRGLLHEYEGFDK